VLVFAQQRAAMLDRQVRIGAWIVTRFVTARAAIIAWRRLAARFTIVARRRAAAIVTW
jgi:hypothetical protein